MNGLDIKSQRKNRANSRPLGSVRASGSATKLPPLHYKGLDGITGAAMSVPPPRPTAPHPLPVERPPPHVDRSALSERPSPAEKVKKTDTSREKSPQKADRDDSAKLKAIIEDLKQQLAKQKESAVVREKEMKIEIMQSQKQIDEIKIQVWDKDKIIEQLKEQFQRQEEHYRELYEKECAHHKETKEELASTTNQLQAAKADLERVEKQLRQECEDIKNKLQSELDATKKQMASEIAVRDEKLTKLKKQMADTLQGNSWERQQQLDELSKELSKAHDEIDMLKMKLKTNSSGRSLLK